MATGGKWLGVTAWKAVAASKSLGHDAAPPGCASVVHVQDCLRLHTPGVHVRQVGIQ